MLKHVTLLVDYKGCSVLYIRVELALKGLKVVRDPLFLLGVLRAIHLLDAPSRDMKIGHDVNGRALQFVKPGHLLLLKEERAHGDNPVPKSIQILLRVVLNIQERLKGLLH